MIKITKGLDIPIAGSPEQTIYDGPAVKHVAVLGGDYAGMKPTMYVSEGDQVKLGQLLFEDKKNPGVKFTAPGAGKVVAINRGRRRVLQSVVIALEGEEAEQFSACSPDQIQDLPRTDLTQNLIDSGLWTAFRTRPYDKNPAPDSTPNSIFVTAMDSNPLAPRAAVVLKEQEDAFCHGLRALRRLTEGKVFVCQRANVALPKEPQIHYEEFDGPHPAGLPGTHIHYLDPIIGDKQVWHINYQDVIAIGQFVTSGILPTQRVIALGGPAAENPRLLRTRLGASLEELIQGEIAAGDNRVVSGSVLNGTTAEGPYAYLGRYHNQVTALPEKRQRDFMASLEAGMHKFSMKKVFLASFTKQAQTPLTTAMGGRPGAVLPLGNYEKVMPLDIQASYLLRALSCGDTDEAQDLGCLELAEEDLALCTFVCSGKNDFGPALREALTTIEKEG